MGRYGKPRCIISDNGTQFIINVIQDITFCFNIEQTFTPVYHPAANAVERRNRDLKTQQAIQVKNEHTSWPEKLPAIRLVMNTAVC